MTTATLPVFRTFTREESSAIYNLHIEREGFVEVIFQSNTERAYGYDADPTFCEILIEVIRYSDLPISVGQCIAHALRNGKLTAIVEAEGL